MVVLVAMLLIGLLALLGWACWRLVAEQRDLLFYRRALAATGCGVVVTDARVPRHPVIAVTPAFRLLTGYSEEEIVGQSLSLLHGPQTERAVIEKLALAMQDGRPCRVLARHYRKDGSLFWNDIALSPIKNRTGTVARYLWVMNDVTQRHQAEEALKQQQETWRTLADCSRDGVLVGTEGVIVYANRAAADLVGAADPTHLLARSFTVFFHPDSAAPVRHVLAARQPAPGIPPTPSVLTRLDGRRLAATVAAQPLLWEGHPSLVLWLTPLRQEPTDAATRLHGLLESAQALAHLGSWEWTIADGTAIWSDEQYRIFGYEPGSVAPTDELFKAALHPDDRERVLAALERTLAEGTPYDVAGRIVQPDGAIRFVRCRGTVVRDDAGRPTRLTGTVQDVTEHNILESVAQDREAQFRLAMEAAPSGMLLVAQDGTITLVNAHIERMFGYSRDELLGRPVECLLPARDHERHETLRRAFLATPESRPMGVGRDVYGRRKDGSEFPVEIGLHPICLTAGTSVLASVIDLTAPRRAEQALRDSAARLELAVQASGLGIFEHDHETDRLYWSPTLRAIYGVREEEDGSLQRYLDLVHPDDRDAVLAAIRRAHDPSGDGRFDIEHRVVRPDTGDIRHLAVRCRTLFTGDGAARRPVRTIGAVVDHTLQKAAESSLQRASKMEAMGTLAGGIAHEFNNSLTAVLGFSELALGLLPAESKAHRHIQQVVAAGRKSRELVHQLLTFSHQSEPVRRPLSLPSLLKELMKLLRPSIPSWIELDLHIATPTRPISADAAQMHQLILNLVDNALSAMRQTGGTLGITLAERELPAELTTPDGTLRAGWYVCLTVSDSGGGLEPEAAARLFDPFFTTQPMGQEHGMALSVVHGIVAAHDGTVVVERRPAGGTVITCYFPALPPCVSSQADEPLPRGHECILFVDDEESLARFGAEMLESLGYYPVVRTNATDAWQAFATAPQRFDLLIADRAMPGLSGERLAQHCRRLRPDLPVILCSGSEQLTAPDSTGHTAGVEYLLKPLSLRDLAQAIRRALDDRPAAAVVQAEQEEAPFLLEGEDAVSTGR